MKPFLRIEKPCEEAVENMHDLPDGKFCDLCSKKVLDLSRLSDSEILNIIQQNKGKKFCGIVDKKQLNKPLQSKISFSESHHPKKITFTKIAAGVALTASILNTYPAQIKVPSKTEAVASSLKRSKETQKEKEKIGDGNIIISGEVLLIGTGKPIEAEVNFITTTKVYSAKTDHNGFYTLEVPKEILKDKNLLEFNPKKYTYDRRLEIFTKEQLQKCNITKITENDYGNVMGEISVGPPIATEKSLVLLGGKKLEHKIFNKSYSLFYDRYDVHYISKPFITFFTDNKDINDIYIVFVKERH